MENFENQIFKNQTSSAVALSRCRRTFGHFTPFQMNYCCCTTLPFCNVYFLPSRITSCDIPYRFQLVIQLSLETLLCTIIWEKVCRTPAGLVFSITALGCSEFVVLVHLFTYWCAVCHLCAWYVKDNYYSHKWYIPNYSGNICINCSLNCEHKGQCVIKTTVGLNFIFYRRRRKRILLKGRIQNDSHVLCTKLGFYVHW